MSDYNEDRRLFHVMRQAGWAHDDATGGFTKRGMTGPIWVSWGQAMDALRLADEGESVAGVAPQSREAAEIVTEYGRRKWRGLAG